MSISNPTRPYAVLGGEPNSGVRYPNPFFDMSKTYIPTDIKKLFSFCRIFFYKNDILHNIVMKLVEYPITDLLFDGQDNKLDEKNKEKYREAFAHEWKVKNLLVEVGIDYHVFGNAFVSANQKFKRYLTCGSCGKGDLVENYKASKVKFTNFKYKGECPHCKQSTTFSVKDSYQKNIKALKFIRWAPENIDIEYDPLSCDSTYYYIIPTKTKKAVTAGKREIVDKLPELYLKSIKDSKKIELDPNNLFHFKRPTLAEDSMAWGKPAILPAMSLIWYMQTLRRSNEAIATEHIVPKKMVFPSQQGAMDPFSAMSMTKWRGDVEAQIKRWKQDPNSIGIMPIPLGYQSLGGDARMHLVTPEINAIEEAVIRSMGLPLEFIKGGSSWTGSSISLRIVENHFLSYREMLLDFMNYFFLKKIQNVTEWPPVKIKFKQFRMSDDSETKQMMVNLNANGKLSDTGLLDLLGIDPDYDFKLKKDDIERIGTLNNKRTISEAKTAGSAMEVQYRAQAQSEWAYQDEKARINEKQFSDELAAEQQKLTGNSSQDLYSVLDKYSREIFNMPPDKQQEALGLLAEKAPKHYEAIVNRLGLLAQFNTTGIPGSEQDPNLAPQEEEKEEKPKTAPKPKKEKTKAQTRGNP